MWAVGPPEPNPPDLVAELDMRGPTQNVTGSEIGLYITFELQIQDKQTMMAQFQDILHRIPHLELHFPRGKN